MRADDEVVALRRFAGSSVILVPPPAISPTWRLSRKSATRASSAPR